MIDGLDKILEGSHWPGLAERVSREDRRHSLKASRELEQFEISTLAVRHGVRGREC